MIRLFPYLGYRFLLLFRKAMKRMRSVLHWTGACLVLEEPMEPNADRALPHDRLPACFSLTASLWAVFRFDAFKLADMQENR